MGTQYHNEALRKARLLERAKAARDFYGPNIYKDETRDRQQATRIISGIKGQAGNQNNYDRTDRFDPADLIGAERNRQAYDHSRHGPVRPDTNWHMRMEANSMYGNKPKYMTNVWKG